MTMVNPSTFEVRRRTYVGRYTVRPPTEVYGRFNSFDLTVILSLALAMYIYNMNIDTLETHKNT